MIGEAVLFSLLISSVIGKEKAILEIVMHRSTDNGEYITEIEKIVGHFTSAGSTVSAEGPILQIHPLSICSQEYLTEKMEYGWVGVMKLEIIQSPCMPLYQQAKKAIQRGATAVVFDITEVPEAAKQLRHTLSRQLDRPVIILRGTQATKLMRIIRTLENARARIKLDQSKEVEPSVNTKEYFDMGIFVAVFVLFCIICIIVVLKLRWRHREQQLSMPELAKRAISKLKTRKYKFPSAKLLRVQTPLSDVYSQSSWLEQCAICLEEYKDGQILRVLPCSHEFHRGCVDPWLVSHGTCPLCLFNIVADHESCSEDEQPTGHDTVTGDLGQSRLYDALSSNNSYEVNRTIDPTIYQQTPPQPEYLRFLRSDRSQNVGRTLVHHVRNTDNSMIPRSCPSCEGTIGSSPSSCGSYIRGFHPILSARGMSLDHTYQNTTEIRCPQAFHRTCCGYRDIGQGHSHSNSHSLHHPSSSITNSSQHTAICNSGISYSHYLSNHNGCHSFHHRENGYHHHPTVFTNDGFYRYSCRQIPLPRKACESDPECSGGSVRDSSIAAQFGSCSSSDSSDRNPSNCSLVCEYCSQCRGTTPIDSTHSTYGSSDIKDVSDSSSCDSNVFYSGAPDQMCTDVSSDKTSISENVVRPFSAVKCSCNMCTTAGSCENMHSCMNKNECDNNSRGSNSSTLNLSDFSNYCDSVYSSKETVELFCRECNSVSPDLSLSNISGITTYMSTENLFSETSHNISNEHVASLPKNINPTKNPDCTNNTPHKNSLIFVQKTPVECQKREGFKLFPCSKHSGDQDFNSNTSETCDSDTTLTQILLCNHVNWNSECVCQTGNKDFGQSTDVQQSDCSHVISSDFEETTSQGSSACGTCQPNSVQLRQSMVVFSEPQGTITVSLQEKYGPQNAV